jgi:hypothetical protein
MTMTFREFLRKKAEEQQQPQRRRRREEWIAAVGRLLDQIRAWLAESDPDKLLDLTPITVQSSEPGLGTYDIPGLLIGVGDAKAQVQPMGRNALGFVKALGGGELRAEGRVDLAAGGHRYILYRTLQDGRDVWYALDDKFQPAPFDRSRLETILQDLL